jgi:putative heme transporter
MQVSGPLQSTTRIEIAPRSVWLVLAVIGLVWLAYRLWLLALILVVALILAGTFSPVIRWLERHSLNRTASLILLFIVLLAVTGVLIFLTIPPLADQMTDLVKQAPAHRARIIKLLNERSFTVPLAHLLGGASVAKTLTSFETYLLGYSTQALRVLGYGITTLVLAFYLLADASRTQGALYAIVPRNYHMRLARILQNMETIVGGYMRGQLTTCVFFGVFTYILLMVLHVPNATSLAIFAALVDVIPFIGGMIVIIPAVLSALPQGLPIAGFVLFALSFYMEFESRVLVPRIYGKALRLSPTAVILALIAGGTLLGIVGALIALPIAAGLVMMVQELRVEMPGDNSIDRDGIARHQKAEAIYEQMSAGATAPEAGDIARTLAADQREAELAAIAATPPRDDD